MTGPDAFTGDDRTELNHTFFATPDESMLSGVWPCAPSREEIESYPVHEMMTVIAGSVTITDAEGNAETFTAGDTFFIPKGTKFIWHITATLRKFYMIAL
ncbi:MAG TPA: cupin domain-containing protein [Kiloniellaceae bacterium]|nr:cupin domain-containing protein [Kiloniellaceae bacterium]